MATTPETETEHEHESELSRLLKPAQPFIEKHGPKLILGIAAILLVVAVSVYWSRSSAAAAAIGWGDIATANQPEDFADIADDNPGTPAAAWARLAAADGYLSSAVKMSFSDRTASAGTFDKARTAFNLLLEKRGTPKEVRERALYGMARLEESTTGDDTSAAVAAFEKLLSEFPESIYKDVAAKRVEDLKKPEVQSFYGWFAKQQPSVTDELMMPNDLPTTPGSEKTGVPALDSILGTEPTPGVVEGEDGPAAPPAPSLPVATPEADDDADAVEEPAEGTEAPQGTKEAAKASEEKSSDQE